MKISNTNFPTNFNNYNHINYTNTIKQYQSHKQLQFKHINLT